MTSNKKLALFQLCCLIVPVVMCKYCADKHNELGVIINVFIFMFLLYQSASNFFASPPPDNK